MDVLDRADLPFPHSLPEFQRLFPDDAACAAYLEKARWGDGFACPHCGTAGEPFLRSTKVSGSAWGRPYLGLTKPVLHRTTRAAGRAAKPAFCQRPAVEAVIGPGARYDKRRTLA